MQDVKHALDESNRLFEEFKKTNDQRLKALEDGRAVDPLITEKLEKLNKAIDDQAAINEQFMATRASVNKLEKQGIAPADEKRAERVAQFQRSIRALASSTGRTAPEVSAEDCDAYCAAFDRYLRRGDRAMAELDRKALSVGVDSEGGYLVTPDLTGRMVTRIFETSPMRQYASVQTISTDALEGSADLDEATFGWVSETGSRSDSTTPQVPAPWRIPVHEAYSQPKATQKMLEDPNIDIQAWLGRKTGDKIGRGFNAAFVTGNGVGKPRGFTTYATAATADGSRAWGTFEHILTGTDSSFGTDPNGANKLIDLIHAPKDQYTANGAFYMNRTTLGKVRQLRDSSSDGRYVFTPSFVAGTPDLILGYPVRKMQDMASYSTADALAIAFGDMAETYQIVDRLGITVLVDPYTSKPYVIFYTRARVGGDVVNFESLKFLKFGD
jgi:HK97 family phage major capsid protein